MAQPPLPSPSSASSSSPTASATHPPQRRLSQLVAAGGGGPGPTPNGLPPHPPPLGGQADLLARRLVEGPFQGGGSAPASPRLLPRRGRLASAPGPPLPPPGSSASGGGAGPQQATPPVPPPRPPPPPPPPPLPAVAAAVGSGGGGMGGPPPTALPLSLAEALAADEELDVEEELRGVALRGGVDWQRRCLELQLELHRLRVAAARARDGLRHRLAELEQRAQEAEARADEAEDRVRLMEQRLATGDVGAADGWVTDTDSGVGGNAQRTISQLETAVEEQRQLRLADARQVEAKAARIKAWVAGKLRDLEAQNAHLREQNARCAQQLSLLRQHLHRPPSSLAGGSGSRASLSLEGEWPPSEEEPLGGGGRLRRPRSVASSLASDASSLPHEPLYDGCGGGVGGAVDGMADEEAAVEELSRDLRAAVAQLQLCSTPGGGAAPAPSPAPQRRLFAPIAGPQAAVTTVGRNGGTVVNSGVYDDAAHDYAEIYTPSRERLPWHAATHAHADGEEGGMDPSADDARPPTPPLHRFPSWESRIYQVAADGLLGVSSSAPAAASADEPSAAAAAGPSAGPPAAGPPAGATSSTGDALGYRDIPPPVYATVKGRASQIRSVPFSGESSEEDSSDGEAGGGGGGAGGGSGGGGLSEAVDGGGGGGGPRRRGASSGADTDTSLSGGSGSSPSKSNRTASSLSPAKRSSSGSPCKSMRRDTSLESGMSDDYAIPPDAMSCDTASASSGLIDASSGLALSNATGPGGMSAGACGLPALLLRASASLEAAAAGGSPLAAAAMAASGGRRTAGSEASPEKSGHLAKLGGKLKTWRKRWFVVRDGQLSYWKSGAECAGGRRPHATLPLDDGCRVSRADGAAAFEVASPQKALYLAADSPAAADEWVRALLAAQRLHATRLLLSREDRRPAAQGWLTKVKNGRARRCWCVLIGRTFLYFKGPCDTHPVGQLNMRECRVEEVEATSDSDSEERDACTDAPNASAATSGTGPAGPGSGSTPAATAPLTVAIYPPRQGPTYLLMPSKQDKDTWLYHLTVVSGGGGGSGGTQYEQLVNKLMEVDGDPNCVLWRHPMLLYTKESITTPLTTLSSEALQAEAIKLFKSCQLFASVALDSAGIDYHVVLAQNALQQCLDMPELQSELVCALVRQTSRHTHQRLLGVQVRAALRSSKSRHRSTTSRGTCSSAASGASVGFFGDGAAAVTAEERRGGGLDEVEEEQLQQQQQQQLRWCRRRRERGRPGSGDSAAIPLLLPSLRRRRKQPQVQRVQQQQPSQPPPQPQTQPQGNTLTASATRTLQLLLCATQSLFACDASSSSSSSASQPTASAAAPASSTPGIPAPAAAAASGHVSSSGGGGTASHATHISSSAPATQGGGGGGTGQDGGLTAGSSAGAHAQGGSGGGAGGGGGGGGLLDCKTNPPTFVFVQGWQLLALAVSLFVPRNSRLLWFLKLHLHRNADSKTECGKYAAYCQRALERTLQSGGREARPSRMEVLSLLLKNPFHHSLPHSIPVHLPSGAYHVVGFDGSSSVEEVLATLCAELGCRDSAASGLALASDDPIERDLEHFVDPQAKLCDVISKWETALREKGSGKFENSRCIQLTLRRRLHWRTGARTETDRERLLLCYETNAQALQGRFPLTRELALELAALMAQIDMGEYNSEKARGSGGGSGSGQHLQHLVLQALDKFYPYRYRDGLSPEELQDLQDRLCAKWAALRGRSLLDCVRIYLTCARKWPFFGHGLFQAKLKAAPPPLAQRVEATGAGCQVWVAVGEEAVTLLDLCAMRPLARFPYGAVVTFGGCQEDFMLVVGSEPAGGHSNTAASHSMHSQSHSQSQTQSLQSQQQQQRLGEVLLPAPGHPPLKLLFALSRPKILELTLLMADYMNAMGHTLPGTPQMNTLTRHSSLRSLPRSHHHHPQGIMGTGGGGGVMGCGGGGGGGGGGTLTGTMGGACASPRSMGTLGTVGGGHTTASTLSSTTGCAIGAYHQVQHATTQTPPPLAPNSSTLGSSSGMNSGTSTLALGGGQGSAGQQQPDLLKSLAQVEGLSSHMHLGGGDSQPGSLHRSDSKKRSPHIEGGSGGGMA